MTLLIQRFIALRLKQEYIIQPSRPTTNNKVMGRLVKVCVVGAGAAGLCAARHFCRLPQFFTVNVIEPSTHVGGVWANPDKNADCLQTNLPKEIIAFPDFCFDPHLPSFASYSNIGQYLLEYADQFQLMPHIQFNTVVISILHNETSYKTQVPGDKQFPASESVRQGFVFDQWSVTTQNVQTNQIMTEIYDAVLICDGHYPVPLMFDLDGLEYFSSGKPLHKDGQILNVGSITGTYSEKNKERPQTLYKHVFNATYPSMAFVGIALTDLPFLCCDLQVRWVFSVWTGFTDLPSAEEMITDSEADYKSWRMLGLSHSHYTHLLSDRKWEYFRELAAKGASKQPECVVKKLHDAIYHYKTTNGKGYKRYQFAVTGYSSFLELSEHKDIKQPFKIAIIGAGVSGIGAARHCSKFVDCISFTVYEQGRHIGGTWIYTPCIGSDEIGRPVHTSMYKNLIANFPHELMAYCDFPFPPNSPTFPTQPQTMQYLENYCKHYNLYQHIKFQHRVDHVSLREGNSSDKDRWVVKVTNLHDGSLECDEFDAVIVCNGHYSKSFIPKLEGLDKFPSEHIIHSHIYRTPQPYANCVVLIVGGGISGKDITLELASVAKEIVWSVKETCGGDYPSNVLQYPCIDRIDGQIIYFTNGTNRKVDKIVLCTGFEYSFPFLDDSCGFSVVNHKKIWPLYKNTFNAHHPTMAFLAMMRPLTFIYRDLQVMWILRVWLGLQELPKITDMVADCEYETHGIDLLSLYEELTALSEMHPPCSSFAGILMQHYHNVKYNHSFSKLVSYYQITSEHWIRSSNS